MAQPSLEKPLILKSSRGWSWPDFGELWTMRWLLIILTLRDIRVRYKQSAIGVVWALLQPLLTVAIFTLILGRIVKIPTQNVPYVLFCTVALLPWQYFQQAFTQGSASLVMLSGMLSKIYFPRLMAPIANVLTHLVDFSVTFILVLALMVWFKVAPGWPVMFLPFFMMLMVLFALSIALWLSILNALYRDVQYALPFMAQISLYLSPVLYPVNMVPEGYQWLYKLNPLVGIIEGFRWCLLSKLNITLDVGAVLISVLVILMCLAGGLVFFNSRVKTIVDRI
ncbi:MAG: ABC transporter permease [Alphaproteobacteria bacterium]|nr:ABC transporter permease [Alphaproteobacteria bacterium]OJV47052.1 MAG: phosphate ABC transporter permease [Alphaproteobacteria bacterium 43-37]